MPMQAESLEVLEKADLPSIQARAIVRAIEIEIAGARDTLATKQDLLLLRQDYHQEMSTLRQEMAEQTSTLRQEMAEQTSNLRKEMLEQTSSLRVETAEQGATLRQEMSQLRQGMADLRGELKAEIHVSVGAVTRQMYTALLGQMAVLLGFAYFFATHLVR